VTDSAFRVHAAIQQCGHKLSILMEIPVGATKAWANAHDAYEHAAEELSSVRFEFSDSARGAAFLAGATITAEQRGRDGL
jgi:hypothetical protein